MRILYPAFLAGVLWTGTLFADQPVRWDWEWGFGALYPKYASVDIQSLNGNYGAFLQIQRNFASHIGLRAKGMFANLQGQWVDGFGRNHTEDTHLYGGDIDLLFVPYPCDPITFYLFGGLGGNFRVLDNYESTDLRTTYVVGQVSGGLGVEWKVAPRLSIITEAGYHLATNSELDGFVDPTAQNGYDTYIEVNAGILFHFGTKKLAAYCESCRQQQASIDYARLEAIAAARGAPEGPARRDTLIIEKTTTTGGFAPDTAGEWVLVGVNFGFNQSNILDESYPAVYDAIKLMMKHPEIKIALRGYADSVGSDAYNMRLGMKRAETVRQFMIAKGISENRLEAVSEGKVNGEDLNRSPEDRAKNRKVVFEVKH